MKAEVKWCNVDKLFYIYRNDEVIHQQQIHPTATEIGEAFISDEWKARFEDMREGKRVRVSERIYYDMLGSVPPKKQTETSFYCGECYSGNLYFYFEKVDGKCYGQLKPIN